MLVRTTITVRHVISCKVKVCRFTFYRLRPIPEDCTIYASNGQQFDGSASRLIETYRDCSAYGEQCITDSATSERETIAALTNRTKPPMFDLEMLEFDEAPAFVIRVGATALEFEVLYANETFRKRRFREILLADDREALLFRSWAQALGQPADSQHECAGCRWAGAMAEKSGALKVIKATHDFSKELLSTEDSRAVSSESLASVSSSSSIRERPALLQHLPRTNLNARWEGIQTMLEMSDVGVFEFNMEGNLMHANEAYYRLSSYPQDFPCDAQFPFMDLVHPEDRPMVMSKWNVLAQGYPVTFEMRWKPQPGCDDVGQYVLTSCVPILDEEKVPISIAGNVIDIDAQKKSQEATQARVEALEQARLSELKFARFAQLSPTALYIFIPETGMKFVNHQFYELTGHKQALNDHFEWYELIADEDVGEVESDWAGMLQGKRSDGVQFRLKKTWVDQDGVRGNIWVQSSSYPELDEHGNVLSIMGTLFDISQFKWAEGVQRRRIEEALEAKRQQENFIDMTSHELRNPLSAVVQCAESATASLEQLRLPLHTSSPTEADMAHRDEEIDSAIDSLQTIVTCSLHQKRVIDDVLTLSKLDSDLIVITPIKVQPVVVILEAMKMFDVECKQMDIKLEFVEDSTAKDFEWVMLDPSRLLQVLINLLTNAIKFTKGKPAQKITVEFGGSWIRPPTVWEAVSLRTDDQLRTTILDEPGWGNGTKAYLWIKVKDTGCGMTEDEQKKLFSRFTQATPRTHVKYGGSGLGLFISKTLATLQGGAIGVTSEKNKGSTFMFFISTRVTDSPEKQIAGHGPQVRPVPFERAISAETAMKTVKLSVLIVEDNIVNQKVLKKQLQKCGWTVHVAGNGEDALRWLKKSIYWRGERDTRSSEDADNERVDQDRPEVDVILLDIFMPVMDGLTCVRRIREWEEQGLLALPPAPPKSQRSLSTPSLTPITANYSPKEHTPKLDFQIPILAVSANARMEQIQEALRAGMNDAITKPFRIPELWPKILSLIPRLSEIKKERQS